MAIPHRILEHSWVEFNGTLPGLGGPGARGLDTWRGGVVEDNGGGAEFQEGGDEAEFVWEEAESGDVVAGPAAESDEAGEEDGQGKETEEEEAKRNFSIQTRLHVHYCE